MCLLAIYLSTLEKCLLRLFFLYKLEFCLFIIEHNSDLHIPDMSHIRYMIFNIFSHSVRCLFIFLMVSFEAHFFQILMILV